MTEPSGQELLDQLRREAARAALRDAVSDVATPPSANYCSDCGSAGPPTEQNDCPQCGVNWDRGTSGANLDDGTQTGGVSNVVSSGYGDMTGSVSSRVPTEKRRRRYKPRSSARSRSGPELRVVTQQGDSGPVTIEGLAVRYEVPYAVYDRHGEFVETMGRGSFAPVVTQDVKFLLNHDRETGAGLPLARTKSGTLTLTDRHDGLWIRAQLDVQNNSQAANLAAAVDRGDIDQQSVGFTVAADEWDGDMTQRRVVRIRQLFDTSAVVQPASSTTTLSVARFLLPEPETDDVRTLRRLRARGEYFHQRFKTLERR